MGGVVFNEKRQVNAKNMGRDLIVTLFFQKKMFRRARRRAHPAGSKSTANNNSSKIKKKDFGARDKRLARARMQFDESGLLGPSTSDRQVMLSQAFLLYTASRAENEQNKKFAL